MNEVGLAETSANEMLEQVVMMLQQGASPEELLQMGVPKELIMQAMEMLTSEQDEYRGNPVPSNSLPQMSQADTPMSMPNTSNNL